MHSCYIVTRLTTQEEVELEVGELFYAISILRRQYRQKLSIQTYPTNDQTAAPLGSMDAEFIQGFRNGVCYSI